MSKRGAELRCAHCGNWIITWTKGGTAERDATVRTRAALAKVNARLDVGAVDTGDWKFIRDALREAAGIADREASRLFAKSKADLAKIEARTQRRA